MSSVRPGRPSGRNIAGGLPTSPRSRSAGRSEARERERVTENDRGRERGDNYDSYRGVPPPVERARSMRSQRSVADMSSSRSGRGGSVDAPAVPPLPRSRRSDVQSGSSTSSRSTSSSSASSTFMDQVKGRGGYASSRTSLEDDHEPRKETGGGWLRQQVAAIPLPEYGAFSRPLLAKSRSLISWSADNGDDEPTDQSGNPLSVWSRVAVAANTLTVSVSKAWASNITTDSGERTSYQFIPFAMATIHPYHVCLAETPPGEESRLTRAMKAYYLEKARDPTDLPSWLFEEHERRPLSRPSVSTWQQKASGPDGYEPHDDPAPSRGRGLRDIYDAAVSTPAPSRQERREMSRGWQDDIDGGHSSKANNRLKALRDAKRNAVHRNVSLSDSRLGSTNEELSSARREYSRGSGPDGRLALGRAPSSRVGVRSAGVGSGLPPRPSLRK